MLVSRVITFSFGRARLFGRPLFVDNFRVAGHLDVLTTQGIHLALKAGKHRDTYGGALQAPAGSREGPSPLPIRSFERTSRFRAA